MTTLSAVSVAAGQRINFIITADSDIDFDGTHLNATITDQATFETPLPSALLLFSTGLGMMGLLGWREKKKGAAALAA